MLTLRLAFRNLFRNTRRTFLTCLLVSSSLAAMILTDGIMLGMLKVMIDTATETFSGEVQVHRRGFEDTYDVDVYIPDVAPLEEEIARDPRVTGYTSRTVSAAMVSSTSTMSGARIYGIDPGRESSVSRLKDAIIAGRYLSGEDGEILIGEELAKLLDAHLGDRIVMTVAAANGGELSQALFRVSGIFRFGMRELDNSLAFISLERSRTMLGIPRGAHEIAVTFSDPDFAASPDLPLRRLATPTIEVQSWKEFMPQISAMIEMVDYSTFIVGLVLFVLASLGVINSMFMSIYERIYEFGVIRAIGTEPGQLVRLIVTEALLIGLLSVVGGLALGGVLSWYFSLHGIPIGDYELSGISFANNIRTVLMPRQFTHYPVYVLLLTVAASIYPARFAARIVPSQALQRTL